MNGYSKDLWLKVLDALDRGTPRREAARLLGVSLSTIKRYLKRRSEGEDLSPRPSPGRTPRILTTPQERRALWAQLRAYDDATLECPYELWERGVRVSLATLRSLWLQPTAGTANMKTALPSEHCVGAQEST